MTDHSNRNAGQNSTLESMSVEKLLHCVADDDLGYRAQATEKLLSMGINSIYPVLERGLRDDNDADFRNGAMDIFVAFDKDAIPFLLKLISDSNEEVRNFTCVMLGDIGNRKAVWALIKALGDMDANVSHSAAEALGKIGDRSALMPLIELLKGDFWVQYSAIAAIAEMRDSRAVPHLLQILDNELLTGAIIDALGKIGDPRSLHPLAKILPSLDTEVAGLAARAMMDIYKAAVEDMNYKNSLVEYSQPEHLKKILNPEAVQQLRSLLKTSKDRFATEAAVMLLGWSGDISAASEFFDLLDDESMHGCVETAIFSFGEKVQPLLVAALDNDNDNVKIVALRTLRYMGFNQFKEKIMAFLLSRNPALQLEAIEAVKHSPEESYLPLLLNILENGPDSLSVRSAESLAIYPFSKLKDSLGVMIGNGSRETKVRAARLLCQTAEEGEPHLLDSLMNDMDATVRKIAMKAARKHGASVAAPRLGAALHDPDPAVRSAAIMAIADYHTPILVDAIMGLLGTADEALDFDVIKSLGMMCAREAEYPLVALLEKGGMSRRLEYALLETLGRISAASSSGLIRSRYLNSPDPDIRRLAVDTLGRLGDTDSLQAVESALHDKHWRVRVAALHVLGNLGGVREIPRLIEAMDDPDNMVRKHAIIVLGDVRSPAAFPALVQQLADMEMSRYAFTSLLKFGRQSLPWFHRHMLKNYNLEIRVRLIDLVGKIGDSKSVEPLMELLDDPSASIRLEAINSLAFCFDGTLLKKLTYLKKNDPDEEVRSTIDLALKTLSMEKYN